MVDGSAVLTLFIVGLGYVPVIWVFKEYPKTQFFYLGYTCLLMGVLASTLRAFASPEFFDFVFHSIGVLGAGVLFFAFAYRNNREVGFLDRKLREIGK